MTTYKVATYNDKATYTVSLDDTGVVGADGLTDDAFEALRGSVERHMSKNGLPAITALGVSVGPYSSVTATDSDPVPGQTPVVEVP